MTLSFLIVLIIPLIVVFILQLNKPKKMMKSNTKKFAIRISKATHFKISIGFIVLLLVLSAISEFIGAGKESATPIPKADANYEETFDLIDSQIMNDEPVDPNLLIEKRTHQVGDTLFIHNEEEEQFYETITIYIIRKSGDDQTVEEFIYKPLLIVNGYDFSQEFDMTMPVWDTDNMTIPKQKSNDITYTTFQESIILNQLTKFKSSSNMGYDSALRTPIVYLKVPENLEIMSDYEDQLIFIDEFE